MPYRVVGVTKSENVPSWPRTQPKWTELAKQVVDLEVGSTLVLEFDNENEAKRAQTAIRERTHMLTKQSVVRTRLVIPDEGGNSYTLYLTRVSPDLYSGQ